MQWKRGKRVAIWAGAVCALVLAAAAWTLGWPYARFRRLFEPLGRNAQGYLEYRHRQTGIVLVRVPGGVFPMGAQKEDPSGPNYDPGTMPDEGPVHEVTLSAFLIAKYEITQGVWKKVMGTNPSEGADYPVENVSWDDCKAFCEKTGLKLPTEAQWEYAWRAGAPAGTHAADLDSIGWHAGNSGRTTHSVGAKRPNAFALFDLLGNVWEWCEDSANGGFYSRAEARGPDPISTSGFGLRVRRGGASSEIAWYCRFSTRIGDVPASKDGHLGFRPEFPLLP